MPSKKCLGKIYSEKFLIMVHTMLCALWNEDERVDYFTGKRLEIDAVPTAELQADGDIIGTTPATVELLPRTLKLVIQD